MKTVERLKTSWAIWRASRRDPSNIIPDRQTRLTDLVEFARNNSPFYRRLYRHLPNLISNLVELPVVTKQELMANFDDWVTDPTATRNHVEAFIADKTLVGQPYLNQYMVWTSSGTTGTPGIFLHDCRALMVYDALVEWRGFPGWVTTGGFRQTLPNGFRMANVVATDGHFAGVAMCSRLPRRYPWLSRRIETFSVLNPVPKLVEALAHFQPTLLVGYPSALLLLAREQTAGRLDIHPGLILTSGEWLDCPTQHQLEISFQSEVRDLYCASEFFYIAFGCRRGWLHLNADWLILEPVDRDFQPVAPGQASHTALLTNLANQVQPLIRYDLGDSITVQPSPCSCGNPLPAIRVAGRRDDILSFQTPNGTIIQVLPLAITTMLEEISGLQRYQILQTAPATLSLRLEVTPGSVEQQVWQAVSQNLHQFLSAQGLSFVEVQKALEPPKQDATSGKFRQVLIDF